MDGSHIHHGGHDMNKCTEVLTPKGSSILKMHVEEGATLTLTNMPSPVIGKEHCVQVKKTTNLMRLQLLFGKMAPSCSTRVGKNPGGWYHPQINTCNKARKQLGFLY